MNEQLTVDEMLRYAHELCHVEVKRQGANSFVVQVDNLQFTYGLREFDAFLEGYSVARQRAWAEIYGDEADLEDDEA